MSVGNKMLNIEVLLHKIEQTFEKKKCKTLIIFFFFFVLKFSFFYFFISFIYLLINLF